MKYAGFMPNDFVNGKGVSVSLWAQGCPFRCPGCHNPEAWDYEGGYEVPKDLKLRLEKAIIANGITRNFSVLGGEPLCLTNIKFITDTVKFIREAFPGIYIYLWTGYELEDIIDFEILNYIDVLITGPYIEAERDISLELRGSRNQKILKAGIDF